MILRNNNNNVPGWDGMGAGKAGQMRIKGRTLGSVLFRLIFQRRVDVRIETGIVLAIKAMRQKAFIDYFSAQFSIQLIHFLLLLLLLLSTFQVKLQFKQWASILAIEI